MLTRLGLGRAALLRASATGLLAFATALAVGAGAWVFAEGETSGPLEVAALATVRPLPSASLTHADAPAVRGNVAALRSLARADAKLHGATGEATAAPSLVSVPREPRSAGPLMEDNPGAWFRIHDAVPRPEPEPVVAATAIPASIPAAAEISDTPELLPGDRVRTTISFYYCQHDPDSANPPGDGGGFCGIMRDGSIVYPGAAACAYAYLGQRFRILGDPLGRIYRCSDTGSAVDGQHRDIWFQSSDEGWNWLWATGSTATIEVVE